MKRKFYAKEVNPEFSEDNLFYQYKDKNTGRYALGMEDEFYYEHVIIYGNRDFMSLTTDDFDRVLELDNCLYELDSSYHYWNNLTEFINCYAPKHDKKKYSKKEIHEWKELFKDFDIRNEEVICKALKLITGKSWREVCIKGYSQSDYQYIYVDEEISDESVDYIEMCYFNTGIEVIVYESYNDFKNNDNGCSYYVDSWKSKERLCEELGCKNSELAYYEWNGYIHTPQWKLA